MTTSTGVQASRRARQPPPPAPARMEPSRPQRRGLEAIAEPAPSGVVKLLLTVKEAALALGVGESKMYRLLGHQELRSVLIGSSRRIPVRELEAYVERLLGDSA